MTNAFTPRLGVVTPVGVMVLLAGIAFCFGVLRRLATSGDPLTPPPPFRPSRFLDLLGLAVVLVFAAAAFVFPFRFGFYYGHPINEAALGLIVRVTEAAALTLLAYRIYSRRPLPV